MMIRRKNGDGTIREIRKNGKICYQALSPLNNQHRLSLGVYPSKRAANDAIEGFKRNPAAFSFMTFEQLYEAWADEVDMLRNDPYVYSYCSSLHQKRVVCISKKDIVRCINSAHKVDAAGKKVHASSNTKQKMKSFFNRIFDHAVLKGIIKENIARDIPFNFSEKQSGRIQRFSKDEIKILWEQVDNPYTSYIAIPVLMCLYHGISGSQIVRVKKTDLHFDRTISVPIDTCGEYIHPIPVHPKLYAIVTEPSLNSKSDSLFPDEFGNEMTYDVFRGRYQKVLN